MARPSDTGTGPGVSLPLASLSKFKLLVGLLRELTVVTRLPHYGGKPGAPVAGDSGGLGLGPGLGLSVTVSGSDDARGPGGPGGT